MPTEDRPLGNGVYHNSWCLRLDRDRNLGHRDGITKRFDTFSYEYSFVVRSDPRETALELMIETTRVPWGTRDASSSPCSCAKSVSHTKLCHYRKPK